MSKPEQRQQQFAAGFVGKTITQVMAQTSNCVIFTFSDGSKVELEGERSDLGIPEIAFGPVTPAPPAERQKFAIDELRLIVRNFDDCRDSFNQNYTIDQLVQIHRMWMACDWDNYPDTWEDRQVEEALQGIVPRWNNQTGEPVYD